MTSTYRVDLRAPLFRIRPSPVFTLLLPVLIPQQIRLQITSCNITIFYIYARDQISRAYLCTDRCNYPATPISLKREFDLSPPILREARQCGVSYLSQALCPAKSPPAQRQQSTAIRIDKAQGRHVNLFTAFRVHWGQNVVRRDAMTQQPDKSIPRWLTIDLAIIVISLAIIAVGIWFANAPEPIFRVPH